ncbi:MAG TPA: ABC transporter permease [Vicinamibacteria bacterium]|nr:ABC transporter permease [Vicinamibacteria bacterium]
MAANTFRETVRERVLYNLVFFAILMTLSGLLLGQLSIRQDERIIKDIGLAAMDGFGTLIAIFVGVGLVSKEIDRRSLFPLLAKPVTRDEFLLGKFAGLTFTLIVNVAVMAAGLYSTLLATGRHPDAALLKAVYTIFLGLAMTVGVALLFSVFTSAALATVCTVSLVVAGRFADVLQHIRDVAPGAPGWLVQVVYYALPNFHLLDLKDHVVYGDPVSLRALAALTAYTAVYLAVILGIALAGFRRREFV